MQSRRQTRPPQNTADRPKQPANGKLNKPKPNQQGKTHFFQHLLAHLTQRNLTQTASSLTFTSILAMVPLLTVVLSIFTAFPIFQDFQVSLEEFLTRSEERRVGKECGS